MSSRFALSVCLSLPWAGWSSAALAQVSANEAAESPGDARPAPRTEVVLGVTGPLDPEARLTLTRLLRAELEPHGLSLVERDPSGEARNWAREVATDKGHLLAVLLDTRGQARFRLVVIDTARGRAISRELPGGERDAANLEAIVSIVLSATNALREGLEVASAPLESVVDPSRASPAPPPPPRRPPPPRPKPEPARGTSLHGSVTAIGASFSDAAEPTFGGALGLGVSIGSFVDVDAGVARYVPADVETELGRFSLERTQLALTIGPVFRAGNFAFVPALGTTAEWIVRSDTRAAPGVALADDGPTIGRAGGILAMRGRLRLLSHDDEELLSVLLGTSASYFGESVRFLAAGESLATVRRSAFTAELGLFVATGGL